MAILSGAAAVKTAAAVLTDKEARKKLGWCLAIILSPLILALLCVLSLAAGTAEHNVSAVQLCFQGGELSPNIPAEYQAYIEDMRDSFANLDSAVAAVNSMTENGKTVDTIRVKALFYALFFGEEQPSRRAANAFADCFVTYEERTRTVTLDDGTTGEESYTVAVPIENLDTVWGNIQSAMEVEATGEIRSNADSVYDLIRYGRTDAGQSDGGGEDTGGPVVSVDGFCSPLGAGWESRVSSEFGYRICPYHGRELHSGLDMAASSGTAIRAALAGTVTKSYFSSSYGNYTVIDHGNGMTTAYAHQSARLVKVGDVVTAGQVIGKVGSTGNSTGPHLHFEVRVDGKLQDPRLYLP